MMSRITLNLKKAGVQVKSVNLSTPSTLLFDRRRKRSSKSSNLLDGTFAISILPSPLPFVGQSSEPREQTIQRIVSIDKNRDVASRQSRHDPEDRA
jgi:hypothetical protein